MNRDDIIRIAREAEVWPLIDHDGIAALERFAELVAAAEREACARVCLESVVTSMDPRNNRITVDANSFFRQKTASECAAAIRARNEKV